ncbi:glycosyltransferase [Phaeobacter inhibens]|uniref:glycosyltransferase n=1 Tax=Phaeobacter inhibens TaxID=221822 RepID=UPI000C9B6F76|nr:glycosyltransferase [Phaeobacter inhibens]AUR09984.1 putative glycosyl transferase [Phaeobacter inhibens]AUR13855.1 putative glycosyl transferase [Phaeobacter inhibens]
MNETLIPEPALQADMQANMQQAGAGRLVAVVVTYNRLAKLKVTLARLLDSPAQELASLVVVDNASNDGTGDWLAGWAADHPRVDVVTSATNQGGAGGFALGMQRAMEAHTPDWLVVMDDDGRPEPGGLAAFHAMGQSGALAHWDAVAAAVYFPSGEICEMNRPSRNPFWSFGHFLSTARKGRDGFHIPRRAYDGGLSAIDVTSFVGFFISAAAVRRVGYPDPKLFIYGDDALYTLGLSAAGGRICFAADVRFEHDFSTFSNGDSGQRFRPLWKVYYHHRNLLLLYRQAAGWLFWPVLLLILPKWILKVRHHPGVRRAYLRLTWLAVRDGLLRRLGRSHGEVLAEARE